MLETILLVVGSLVLLVNNGFADVNLSYEEGDIRLADGPNPFQGRLEIYYEGSWGTVCSDVWNDYNAQLVCRQLGFPDGVLIANVINKFAASSTSSILLSNVTCDGTESSLSECPRNDWNDNDCDHEQDVNVYCKVHSYRGCFISQYPNYALTGKQVGLSDPLTLETCIEKCENYQFMGLEGGDSCFCGPSTDDYTTYGEVDVSECTIQCGGDSAQYCGGSNRIAVYERGCLATGSSSGVITSHNFPGYYGSNQQCQVQIDLSMNVKTDVTFHLFELTGDDALTLTDELGDTVTYSASNPPEMCNTIEVDTLIVDFISSATSSGGAGYVITYRGLLKCPKNIQFANGTIIMEDHEFYYEGDTATVICDDGFDPEEEEIICTDEGVWFPAPSCIEVSPSELPDEEQPSDKRSFQPILLMCVVLIAILGIIFCIIFIGIICTGKQGRDSDKMPLENADSPAPSVNSEPVDHDMFDGNQGNDNPQVAIEEGNGADMEDEEEEDRYLSHIY